MVQCLVSDEHQEFKKRHQITKLFTDRNLRKYKIRKTSLKFVQSIKRGPFKLSCSTNPSSSKTSTSNLIHIFTNQIKSLVFYHESEMIGCATRHNIRPLAPSPMRGQHTRTCPASDCWVNGRLCWGEIFGFCWNLMHSKRCYRLQ